VIGTGEGGAALVTAPDAGPGRVLHRERRARAGGGDGHARVVEAVAGAVADEVNRVGDAAAEGIDVDRRHARRTVCLVAAELDLPGQARRAPSEHDQTWRGGRLDGRTLAAG